MTKLVWFVLALCLLGACSSGPGKQPGGSHTPGRAASPGLSVPTPTSNVSVKPAESAWSRTQEITGYRAAMKPVTRELDKLATMTPDAGLRRTKAALVAYSKASTAAVESILAGKWSSDVLPGVNVLVAALLQQQEYFDALADRETKAAIVAQGTKTSQTLLVTRYFADAVEQDLGISDGLLDPAAGGTP